MRARWRGFAEGGSRKLLSAAIMIGVVFAFTGEVRTSIEIGLLSATLDAMAGVGHRRLWSKLPFGKPRQPEYSI